MLRILILGMHDKIGGVETFLMNYYRNINREEIQFDFINMYDKLCFEEEIIQLGGKIYNVPNVKKHPIKYYNEIKKIIINNSYNIVHINMLSVANILPILAAKSAKTKNIIVHSHNSNTPKGIIRKILNKVNKKIMLKKATDFFACSNLAGEWMFGKKQKFHVINNAIDIQKYQYNENIRNKIRKELNIDDKFVIGHVGRFSEQKNHEFLIEIYKEITKIEKESILLLIGEGELKKEIEEKVNKYKIADRVIFLGTTDKINEYYQAMDLFILPSKFEGLPVVGVEVQANGLPCILSNNITKEIKINDNVFFLDISNLKTWVEYILRIEKENAGRQKNIKSIEKNYNIEIQAQKLVEFYKNQLNGGNK